VHQVAKWLGMSSKECIAKFCEIGIPVKTHSSTVTEDEAAVLERYLKNEAARRAEEEKRRKAEEEAKRRAEEEARRRAEEEAKRRELEEQQRLRAEEEKRRKIEEQRRKAEEEARRRAEEQARRAEEERRKAEEQRRKEQELAKAKKVEKKPPAPPKPAPPKPERPLAPTPPHVGDVVELREPVHVGDLASALMLDRQDILQELSARGAEPGPGAVVDPLLAQAIAADLGITVKILPPERPSKRKKKVKKEKAAKAGEPQEIAVAPVVTVMGHVDHGKTTLLDAIRNTNVVEQEFGGITQHIGASDVKFQGRRIVFIDTPGHELFTAMRARGAQVTNIAVLVVAADDGVMPQTIEAINHARAANVPIIVAINKIDVPGANPDRVMQQLAEQGLVPEEWGGDTVCVKVSALQRTNLDELLEMILLVADLLELKARIDVPARGVVIEARLDPSRGPLATVLIKEGILRRGDAVICGTTHGKVRLMQNWRGVRLEQAGPSEAVEVAGLTEVPMASDELRVVENAKVARQMAREAKLAQEEAAQRQAATRVSLEALFEQMKAGEVKELALVVKADTQGSLEALCQAIEKLHHEEIRVTIVHRGVGGIGESDINLAAASNAIVIGFHVGFEPGADKLAEDQKVDVRLYTVIYEVVDDIKDAMAGMLKPIYREVYLGEAEVRQLFRISRLGVVAGCHVTNGIVRRGEQVRVRRDGAVVFEGRLTSLKHLKEDIREIGAGRDCGILLEGFDGFQEGDIIEVYTLEEVKRTL